MIKIGINDMEVRMMAESEKIFGVSGHIGGKKSGEKDTAENIFLESIGIYSPRRAERIIADKMLAFLRKLNK